MANPPPSAATAETNPSSLPSTASLKRRLPLKSSPHQTGRSVRSISHNPRQEPSDELSKPNDINSIAELRSIFGSLSGFLIKYEELHEHLDFIGNFIDSKLSQSSFIQIVSPAPSVTKVEAPCNSLEVTDDKVSPPFTEVEHLCKTMAGRGLRRYIVNHLEDISKLVEEIPVALRLAHCPARMVLDCLGGFYIQSFRAFTENSKMVPSRQASIFILECYLRMGSDDDQIDSASRTQAHEAAIIWRDRLNKEGGVLKACEWDARGLLLLICCFGIPKPFKNDDIRGLIKAIKTREIDDLLGKSAVLAKRIPGMIEGMLKNGMEVEAMNLAYIFGMEDRFPPQTILTTFLQESEKKWKKTKYTAHISLESLNQANIKHLSNLKSVENLLEDHNIDPLNLLPSWEIKDTIARLAKEISDTDKKISKMPIQKRRVEENEVPNYLENQELKRLRLSGPLLLHQHNNVASSMLHQHNNVALSMLHQHNNVAPSMLHQHNNVSSSMLHQHNDVSSSMLHQHNTVSSSSTYPGMRIAIDKTPHMHQHNTVSSSSTNPGMRIALDKTPHIYYSPSAISHSANPVVANNADLMSRGDVNLLVDRYLRMGDRETLAPPYGEPAVFRGNVPPYEIAGSRLQQQGYVGLANPSHLVSSNLNDHQIYQYGSIGESRLSRGGFGVEPQNVRTTTTTDNRLLPHQNVSSSGRVPPFAGGSAYGSSSSSSYLY